MSTVASNPTKLKGSEGALVLLAEFMSPLTAGPSHWYLINPPPPDDNVDESDYDYQKLLGMSDNEYKAFLLKAGLYTRNVNGGIKVNKHAWDDFITRFFDNECNDNVVELSYSRVPVPPVVNKRNRYYAIRIGDKDKVAQSFGGKNNTFANQLTKKISTPKPTSLRALQRRLMRGSVGGIVETIIREKDLYETAMEVLDSLNKRRKPASTKDDASAKAEDHPTSAADGTCQTSVTAETTAQAASTTTNPPPPKKRRVEAPTLYDELCVAAGDLSKHLGANKIDEENVQKHMDKVYAIITQLKMKDRVVEFKDRNLQKTSLLRVPVASSDKSFRNSDDWVDRALEINGKGDIDSSRRRVMQYLVKSDPDCAEAALEKLGIKAVKQMNATKVAAMGNDANLNGTQKETVLRHLRDHFGKNSFASRAKVAMHCEGATPIKTGSIEYSYEDGDDGKKETINYSEKNIALETAQQLSYVLTNDLKAKGKKGDMKLRHIKRTDVVLGGDHGCGAFVAGAKVIVTFLDGNSKSFDVSVAEVMCRKDNAEILEKTIVKGLTDGLKTMAENKLSIVRKKNGEVGCIFGDDTEEGSTILQTLKKVNLFVTGDLAFYAMVLGKEGMSAHWCHLCKLSRTEFQDRNADGDKWTKEAMVETAEEVANDGKSKLGVKSKLWWPFIDICNYVVPLLHALIGIGNDILDNLKDIVDDKIERISTTEAKARTSLTTMEDTIESLVAERKSFDESKEGKELKSSKRKIKGREDALKLLGVGDEEEGDADIDLQNLSNDELLDEVNAFVEASDNGDTIEEDDEVSGGNDGEHTSAEDGVMLEVDGAEDNSAIIGGNTDPSVASKILELKGEIAELEPFVKLRQEQRDAITNRLKKARALVSKMKERVKKNAF